MAKKKFRKRKPDPESESESSAEDDEPLSDDIEESVGEEAMDGDASSVESEYEEEEEEDGAADESAKAKAAQYPSVIRRTTHVKKKVLVVCSRGVTSANIELMEDLLKLLPHARKDPKFDKKEPLTSIVEIAEMSGCHYTMYLEARKMRDLYLWVGKIEGGPSVKFLVQQVRPMRDLRLTGNCLKGSRPILSFDGGFNGKPEFQILKRMLSEVFGPPKGHPRSKPFHDHVLSFSLLEGRIMVRHYQMVQPQPGTRKEERETSLVEIGPRFALTPIRMLGGCFSGESLYVNEGFQSPNVIRAEAKRKRARSTVGHVAQKEKRRRFLNEEDGAALPGDELDDVFDD